MSDLKLKQKNTSGSPDKVIVGLVQINNSFSGQNYLPLSIGLLESFVRSNSSHSDRYEFLSPIYSRSDISQMVDHLSQAQIIGFSVYIWNIRISLEIARRIKALNPKIMIIMGGPQVPDNPREFLYENRFVDIVCHGEGEMTFLSILDQSPNFSLSDIGSISYIDGAEKYITNPRSPRIQNLSLASSPYLDGTFDRLIIDQPQESWLALWETNRGCPFSCTFCDWGSATASKVYSFDMDRLRKEINWFSENKIEFVFCCDANFGILPRDLELTQHIVQIKEESGYPHALSVQNTKNATERAYEVQKLLANSGLNKGVTISLQSVDEHTLKSIKRQNISTESFQELQHRFTRDKIETYSDMILGLPGETYDSFLDGISYVIENGQHNRIQFNNLSILPNAEMGDPEYQQKYGMVIVESQIFNIHGSNEDIGEEIAEIQQLVIATEAMPKEDWVRTRAFCWLTGLLHFDKILQIPLILIHETCDISYRRLLESFADLPNNDYPVISEIIEFFHEKARSIQKGESEYCHSREWLNIGWPADEYVLIDLCVSRKLDSFYAEVENHLSKLLADSLIRHPESLLHDTINLNKKLIKLPFQFDDIDVPCSHNIWEYYQSVVSGSPITLDHIDTVYHIDRSRSSYSDWDTWLREVIWYGNKKGAYLYGSELVTPQLSGHY